MSGKIVIAGGTGSLGSIVLNRYAGTGTELVVLTRSEKQDSDHVRYVKWDAENLDSWVSELEGSTAVINLAGKSVNCRYTSANKERIIRSRVDSTAAIGKAVQQLSNPPGVWINAGSAAIFGNSGDEIMDEHSVTGQGFSPEVCKAWEHAFNSCQTPHTRKVFLRIGMVLQKKGGVLKPFLNLARSGFGGKIGSGEQYITWIHEQDFADLIDYIVYHELPDGTVHAASPAPVTNKEFMAAIRKAAGIPFGIANPAFLTRIGAVLIGTEADLVLSGRRVVSSVLEGTTFQFNYSDIHQALQQLIHGSKLSAA